MNRQAPSTLRVHLSLTLLSAALIAFQLEQMQILALVQWHHFAYLIISVALLGFGAGGTFITLNRSLLLNNIKWLPSVCMFGCSAIMALALIISGSLTGSFDICLLFIEPGQAGLLLLSQAVYLLVFFSGGLPLGLLFIGYSKKISSLYSANLVGSGLGGLAAVVLMNYLLPQQLPALTALLPWFGGILLLPQKGRTPLLAGAIASLAIILTVIALQPQAVPSQYKAISRALDLPGAAVTASAPSPLGLAQTVSTPFLRYAPGLSLTYTEDVTPPRAAMFINGDWFGPIYKDAPPFLAATLSALPYFLSARKKVLVLGAGTELDVLQAAQNGSEEIVTVEPHRKATALVRESAEQTDADDPLSHPQIKRVPLTPRSFLALDRAHYDLITLPTIGSFGGGAGLFALQEQHLLTREGFQELWNHLTPEGILRLTTWLDSPARNPLRLAATIAETLETAAVSRHHVAAVRNWNMITFIVKKTPFSFLEISAVRSFCKQFQFDPVLLPGSGKEERLQFHTPSDPSLSVNVDNLFSAERRKQLAGSSIFAIQPVDDNRPFFSQFLRLSAIPHLVELFGERSIPYIELGYLIALINFAQISLLAVLLIIIPLLRFRRPERTGLQKWIVPFFGGLGLGYMFVEIMLIHELTRYFGHPIYAAAAGISTLLIFSGMGSLLAERLPSFRANPALAAGLVALLLLLYHFILTPLLQAAFTLEPLWKLLVFLLLIAPPALIMGMPFPLGLQQLAQQSKRQAAWAWSINGCVSVTATGLAAIIAVELGFAAIQLIAAIAYGLAALAAAIPLQRSL